MNSPLFNLRKRFKILSAFAALLVLATDALPAAETQNEPRKNDFEVLPGQRILLNGDSIVKGYGFGNYTNPSPLRTLYGIANILLKENLPHPPPVSPLPVVWQGLNDDGTPKTVDTLASEIQTNVRRGEIRPGDWMIYEDAGGLDGFLHPAPWPNTNNIYARYRQSLRDMVLEADNSIGRDHILMMTMFDYEPKYPWCEWDAPLDDGVRTGNDAVRDEAAALGVRVIDMNRIMDRAQDYIGSGGWGKVVGPDGIHPNVFGNYVMTLAILGSVGGDIAAWKLEELQKHFRHPRSGGDVETVWGFTKDPTDQERFTILNELRKIVAAELKLSTVAKKPKQDSSNTGHTFTRLIRHGRILDHPTQQPEGTTKPCSYELGKLFQLDATNLLLVASLREQGGHDFAVGNDGVVFQKLSDIAPERAFPINRLEPNHKIKSSDKTGVLAKFPANGAFMPLNAKAENGETHSAGGTGFLLSTVATFLPDRSEMIPKIDHFVELIQLAWDGKTVKVTQDKLPEPFATKLRNVGFSCVLQNGGFLSPVVSAEGIIVVRFEFKDGRWQVADSGKPFVTVKGECEPSLRKVGDDYFVYTRSIADRRGRVYRSHDGLNYYLAFDHWNYTVPQSLNQGLDDSLYLTTATGPGMLRNPLLAFALRGQSFVNPILVHDEKQIGDDKGAEVPFCDHAIASNVLLNKQWRHLLLYRVCDLRETNGEGAPPKPHTGLYLAEFEYEKVTNIPFKF